MTEPLTPSAPAPGKRALRWRTEILLAVSSLGIGLLVLPALIYAVGVPLLGPYGGGEHIGSFYGDFIRNLIGLVGRTWFIVLAPYLLLSVMRLVFWPWGKKTYGNQPGASEKSSGSSAYDLAQPSASRTATPQRREPFIAP